MDRILIILKKENRSRASSALTLGLNTIILKHVYWYTYMQQISGERLQDHWSSGFTLSVNCSSHVYGEVITTTPLGASSPASLSRNADGVCSLSIKFAARIQPN